MSDFRRSRKPLEQIARGRELKKNLALTPEWQPPRTQGATPCGQAAPMTRRHQRSLRVALTKKEATVRTLNDAKNQADLLGEIPVLSTCTRDVLEEFLSHGVDKLHCAAGRAVNSPTSADQNLYVLVSGSATLDAGDDVHVALEPGDYFGSASARRHHMTTTVTAEGDVEILVIRPQELIRLQHASSRDRHPSQIEWRHELTATSPFDEARRSPAMAS
jgi:Cyclic nucleotide-binding domain